MARRPAAWHPGERYENDLSQVQGDTPSARQHLRRAGRPLERQAPQDGDLGMDRLVVAFVIAGAVGVKKPGDYIGPGDSGRADKLALDHFPKDVTENVLIEAPKGGSA